MVWDATFKCSSIRCRKQVAGTLSEAFAMDRGLRSRKETQAVLALQSTKSHGFPYYPHYTTPLGSRKIKVR